MSQAASGDEDQADYGTPTSTLEDFFVNGTVGLHIVSGDGIILRANKAELELLGYSDEEYIGRSITEFHADPPVISDILARLSRGEQLEKYPARLRAKDGSIRHVLIASSALFRDGQFINTRCFTFDITAAKLAEDRIREGEQRFQDMFQALPIAIFTTDAQGDITFYNQAAADLAGRIPELGSDKWCVIWRLYTPDGAYLPHDQCPLAVALKERRAVTGAELIAERPDGTRARIVPYPTPLFDKNGRLTGAINMLLDITERHAAELESSRLAAIVATSEDAIITTTVDGFITYWNKGACNIHGYESHEMIGQHIARIIPRDLHGEHAEVLEKVLRGEHIQHYETERLTKDGRCIDISLTVSPVRDPSGNLVGASKVGRDITARKRDEQLQNLLIDELNHRVKNTLATVQSLANQTVRSASSGSDFSSSFNGRLQALAQAHTLLSTTLWLGADVQTLIRDQLLMGDAEERRVTFSGPTVTLAPQVALHLALVLHELGSNARKFGALSALNGHLSLKWTVQTNGGRTLLLQWQERDGPPVTAPTRRGFGTTLIEQSLRAHGGKASLDYEAEGVTCQLSLPLPESDRQRTGAYNVPLPAEPLSVFHEKVAEPHLRGLRILVVDDEPLVAMDIMATLAEAGCEIVGPASTIHEAKVLIEESGFDAALLDANLGGHSVDELAAALTRLNIPFAFVTGYGRERMPRAFRHAPLIGKPFSPEQLVKAVAQLVPADGSIVRLRENNSDGL